MRSFRIAHLFDNTVSALDDIRPTFASVMVDIYRNKTVKPLEMEDLITKIGSLEENLSTMKQLLKES